MKRTTDPEQGDLREEYDLHGGRPNPYAARMKQAAATTVVIDPDLFAVFPPTAAAVNDALRLLVREGAYVPRTDVAHVPAPKQAKAS